MAHKYAILQLKGLNDGRLSALMQDALSTRTLRHWIHISWICYYNALSQLIYISILNARVLNFNSFYSLLKLLLDYLLLIIFN